MNGTEENWGFILLMITLTMILSWVASGSEHDYSLPFLIIFARSFVFYA